MGEQFKAAVMNAPLGKRVVEKENQFWPCDAFYLHFFLLFFGFLRYLEINIFCKLEQSIL